MKQTVLLKSKPGLNEHMLKIGITGGIGSGKSAACKIFEGLGVPVYYADDRAKYLMQHEHFLIDQIKKNFGESVYENGRLNRGLLSELVFHDKAKLNLLNSLVHPAVFRDTERWTEEQREKNVAYTLKEAALLIETGSYKALDHLIVVTAPLDVRVSRITQRDKTSAEEVMARVRNQLPEEEKLQYASYIIHNDSDETHLEEQVKKIHEQILQVAT
jgi:dephospho-CoA kinase